MSLSADIANVAPVANTLLLAALAIYNRQHNRRARAGQEVTEQKVELVGRQVDATHGSVANAAAAAHSAAEAARISADLARQEAEGMADKIIKVIEENSIGNGK